MKSKYLAAFLLPKNNTKFLCDDGWEFEGSDRIPREIEPILARTYALIEQTLMESVYESATIKINIFKDEQQEIEYVYFRFYDGLTPAIPGSLKGTEYIDQLEFFVPS